MVARAGPTQDEVTITTLSVFVVAVVPPRAGPGKKGRWQKRKWVEAAGASAVALLFASGIFISYLLLS
jgi:hypothetical protein